jgi:hypothetical protein
MVTITILTIFEIKMKKSILASVLFISSSYANATNYYCEGQVTGVAIEPSTGELLAEKVGPLNWPRFCSVVNQFNGISPEACKVVYSTLLAAQTSNKGVKLWFKGPGNCEEHVAWQPMANWYFGPKLIN